MDTPRRATYERAGRLCTPLAIAIAIAVGLIHTLSRRWSMNSDGVSYLDIADRYRVGDFSGALNATWSPFFSWLLALTPGTTLAAHLTVYALYLASLVAFLWFLRVLTRGAPRQWYVTVFASAVFLWATLYLVDLQPVAPDMGVVALVFCAAALVVEIRRRPEQWLRWVLLGIVLGAAYLAKAAMFYVSLVIMAGLIGSIRPIPLARVTLLFASFAVVSLPWIVALSRHVGHPTVSETGKLVIAWAMNGVTSTSHWQGIPPEFGTPTHPTRHLLADPHVFEFGSPLPGTFPPWYDPSYWYDGVNPRPTPARVARTAMKYIGIHGWLMVPLIVAILSLPGWGRALRTHWPLNLSMLAGIALYAVIHLETRYMAGFAAVLYLTTLVPLLQSPGESPSAQVKLSALVVGGLLLIPVLYHTALRSHQAVSMTGQPDPNEVLARALRDRGLAPASPIAVIGTGMTAYWARAGRLRIVAEIPEPQSDVFWSCSAADRQRVLGVLAGTGAVRVIANVIPSWAETGGWERVGPLLIAPSGTEPARPMPGGLSRLDYRDTKPCSPRPIGR